MKPIQAKASSAAVLQPIKHTAPKRSISSLAQSVEIPITNCVELFRIGNSPLFPANGKYTIKSEIRCLGMYHGASAKIKNGTLNGEGHNIHNLKTTLFKSIEDSVIHDLTIKLSTLSNKQSILSESISGNSELNNIKFRNVKLYHAYTTKAVGILSSSISDNTKANNINIENSMIVVTEKPENATLDVGLLAGSAHGKSQLLNIKVHDSILSVRKLNLSGNNVGGCVGLMSESSHALNLIINETSITSKNNQAATGGAVGLLKDRATVEDVLVRQSNITSLGNESHTGGVLGVIDSTYLQTSLNSYENKVLSTGHNTNIGGVVGQLNNGTHARHLLSVKNEITANKTGSNVGGIIGLNAGDVKIGLSINDTAICDGKPVSDAISVDLGESKYVFNETDCPKANLVSHYIDEQCNIKNNGEMPTTILPTIGAVSAGWGAGVLAGTAVAATVGGLCYLIREYVRANKTESTNKVKLFFKPITSKFSQANVYDELEEFNFNEEEETVFTV